MTDPVWKFKDWIPNNIIEKYNMYQCYILCTNSNCMWLIYKNLIIINWYALSLNPSAIELLVNNQDKIDWINLSLNPAAIDLLLQN